MHRGRFELPEREPRQFYGLLALDRRRPMREKSKIPNLKSKIVFCQYRLRERMGFHNKKSV